MRLYWAASRPENDTSAVGGAIDLDWRAVFTQMGANDTIEAVSDNAGDTMNITVVGRSAAGAIVSETKALTGTTFISLDTLATVERVLKASVASDPAGIITVRRATGDVTIGTIPVGERGFEIMFYNASSSPSGALARFEKIFAYNANATLDLLGATVELDADPSTVLTIRLEDAQDDNNSAANRLTEPTGNAGSWTGVGTAIAVTGTDLQAVSGIGLWVNQDLLTDNAPIRASFDVIIAGSTV